MEKKNHRPGSKKLLFVMLCLGLLSGVISRLLDIYTTNLGEIFSQMAVWILIGTLISIYSPTAKQAMGRVFTYCMGMLAAYYGVAALSHGVYGGSFILGWTVFAFCSPGFAFAAWYGTGRGLLPRLIGTGIVAVSVLSSVVLFDRLRIYDLVIDGLLIYFLFIKKIPRDRE